MTIDSIILGVILFVYFFAIIRAIYFELKKY